MKFEAARIQFSGDVLAAVAIIVAYAPQWRAKGEGGGEWKEGKTSPGPSCSKADWR